MITIQMDIERIEPDELKRRTPKLVESVFSKFEALLSSNTLSTKKILKSFYDLDNPRIFDSPWGEEHEVKLQALKELVNEDKFHQSKETDIRVYTQLLMDFFEDLSESVVSQGTVEGLKNVVEEHSNSNKGPDSHRSLTGTIEQRLHTPRTKNQTLRVSLKTN